MEKINKTKDFAKEVEVTFSSTSPPKTSLKQEDYLSTGSTLLDLAISGGRVKYGGIPKGIVVEIYGPASSGKTALLSEACSIAQKHGGKIQFLDPEGRLDKEYSRIYGLSIKEEDYSMPDTVEEVFNIIKKWEASKNIDVIACDSLAALCTKMEMEDKDQYGMRRAKEFSQGLRRIAREVSKKGVLLLLTNQVRDNVDVGFGDRETTPGGRAIGFYSSLRIRVGPAKVESKIKEKIKIANKEVSRIVGITSNCTIKKSSVDDPFREAETSIIFSYGVDDIRDMLKYCKHITGSTVYEINDKYSFKSLADAIDCVEKEELYSELKEKTIFLWKDVEARFRKERKPKDRG